MCNKFIDSILKDLIINLIVNLVVLYIYFNGYDTNKD